jgi:hypothetical protein
LLPSVTRSVLSTTKSFVASEPAAVVQPPGRKTKVDEKRGARSGDVIGAGMSSRASSGAAAWGA